MKKAKVWYAIADGGRARFVERDENGAYRTIVSFDSADLHHKARDLGSDGRTGHGKGDARSLRRRTAAGPEARRPRKISSSWSQTSSPPSTSVGLSIS